MSRKTITGLHHWGPITHGGFPRHAPLGAWKLLSLVTPVVYNIGRAFFSYSVEVTAFLIGKTDLKPVS
jgi:hypothetical protein